MVHGKTGEIVEDKIFHVMFTDDAEGEPVELFEGGRNAWRTMEDMKNESKRYKSFDLETRIGINRGPKLTENVFEYSDDEF